MYLIPGDQVIHHTPFFFKVVRKNEVIADRNPSVIYVDEGDVPRAGCATVAGSRRMRLARGPLPVPLQTT
jgi:hypothetical protein